MNVRSCGSTACALLVTQPSGALGTVSGVPNVSGGIWWWSINYDNSPDGWSTEDALVKVIAGGVRGDLDGDGDVDLDDLRRMIYMLIGTAPKDLAKADLDGDGQLLLVDLQTLVKLLVGIP